MTILVGFLFFRTLKHQKGNIHIFIKIHLSPTKAMELFDMLVRDLQ